MCVCVSIYVGYCIYCLLRFTRHLQPPLLLQSGNTFQAPRSDRLRVGADGREKDCPQPVSSRQFLFCVLVSPLIGAAAASPVLPLSIMASLFTNIAVAQEGRRGKHLYRAQHVCPAPRVNFLILTFM